MPQEEVTNNRPKNYSKFRRTLSFGYCTDGDFFEQRVKDGELVAVAYIETIQIPNYADPKDYPVWDSKKALAEEIKNKMNIPAFYVYNIKSCNFFYIMPVGTDKILKLSKLEYINFLKHL